MAYFTFFLCQGFEIWCAFYIYSTLLNLDVKCSPEILELNFNFITFIAEKAVPKLFQTCLEVSQ